MALLGLHDVQIPEQKWFNDQPFPLVLQPTEQDKKELLTVDDICHWVHDHVHELKDKLLTYGAVLFRDFGLSNANDFDEFVKAFELQSFPYIGGAAPRKVVVGNVFTANEAPPSELIPFHHEMAQVPNYPKVLFFYCDVAPPEGGETPLVISNVVYNKMVASKPDFVKKLEEHGVRYIRVLPNGDDASSPIGRGWQSTYQTDDATEAEKQAKLQGTEVEWLSNGCLRTVTKVLPATRLDERVGKQTWFNSVIAAYTGWQDCRNDRKKAVVFGNGDGMPEDCMSALQEILEENCVAIRWKQGDVIMIDNRQVMHSRRAFVPPRRILACLCAD